ncbi:PQQ-dependent sugar dehydrogenase [Falsirhodobacter halotolerans]|uniref:PQQ-dependent sugar dehydrogenase n=1 Tax=Falsirhodobacter halotolerans TaxID=1146892 RepID=UPI001FD28528|nr:PQQ-dependent sugar dehydrogenase [Falsirhodobacter halotolerans]MCJ8138845.1 PQQ-dependent sugar dehydrogenase [Falsirhodobacter halotolerans]
MTRSLRLSVPLAAAMLAPFPLMAQETRPSVETAAPNAPDQTPAFEGQTRAPQPAEPLEVATETVAQGLPQLWAMEFLPDGRMLVTAKKGDMHIVADGTPGPAIEGVPEVDADGQGGLLDVALANDFADSGIIYFSYAEPREDGNGTALAKARLVEDGSTARLEDVEVIFAQQPTYDGNKHFGSRIVVDADDVIWLTVGERSDEEPRVQAQDVGSHFGKVIRITAEGDPAEGNPFIDQDGAMPEIWSLGHRNTQSAALSPEGEFWMVEHGPKGGDELNRPEAGLNYGWPEVTYGVEYSGEEVGEGITQNAETQQPLYYWDPVIAPSGMAFYEGEEFPEWDGAILIGGLVTQGVVVLGMDGDTVEWEDRIPLEARVRDVRVGPDGAIYAVTENRDEGSSTIVRITAPDA